jgi:hypothetical protein
MSNRRVHVLASMTVVFLAGFYSQAIQVNSQSNWSISSRTPSNSDGENPSAVANDDYDDVSDNFVLLHGTLNWLPLGAAIMLQPAAATTTSASHLSTRATLELQHTLLRL